MSTFEVQAPLAGFTGNVVGIDFTGGLARVDTDNDLGRAAYAYFERAGYRMSPVVDEEEQQQQDGPQTPADDEPFDPSAHGVDDVLSYLGTADLEEAVRVLDAEAASSKARVTITRERDAILATKTTSTPPQGDNNQKGPGA